MVCPLGPSFLLDGHRVDTPITHRRRVMCRTLWIAFNNGVEILPEQLKNDKEASFTES